MKKLILSIFLIGLTASGCAYGRYDNGNGATMTYFRLWNQKVSGVSVKTADKTSIKIDSAESENQALADTLAQALINALIQQAKLGAVQ